MDSNFKERKIIYPTAEKESMCRGAVCISILALTNCPSVYHLDSCEIQTSLDCQRKFERINHTSLLRGNWQETSWQVAPLSWPSRIHKSGENVEKEKNEAEGNRTPNLRDWNPTRYHCATAPLQPRKNNKIQRQLSILCRILKTT